MERLIATFSSIGRVLRWPCAILLLLAAAGLATGRTLGVEGAVDPLRFITIWTILAASALLLIVGYGPDEYAPEKSGGISRKVGRWLTTAMLALLGLLYLASTCAWLVVDRPDLWWQLAFLPASFACFARAAGITDVAAIERFMERRKEKTLRVTADSGKPRPLQESTGVMLGILGASIALAILAGLVIFGVFVWEIWQRALLEGRGTDLSHVGDALAAFLIDPKSWKIMALPFGILVAFGAVLSLLVGIRAAGRRRRYGDSDRDLMPLEIEYLQSSYQTLMQHMEASSYPRWYGAIRAVGGLVLVGGLFAGAYVALRYQKWGVYTVPTDDGTWSFHVDDIGFGGMLAVFTGLTIWTVVAKAIPVMWPHYGEFLGKRELEDEEREIHRRTATINSALVAALRDGDIGAGRRFDPGSFLRHRYARSRRLLLWGGLILLIVNAYLLYLDVRSYDRFSDSGIEHVEYWSLEKRFVGYDEIRQLAIWCNVDSDDDVADLVYELNLGDDEFASFKSSRFMVKHLDDYLRIDRHVTAAGVPIAAVGRHATIVEGGVRLDRECTALLEENYDRATLRRFYELFHIVPVPQ